MASTVPLFYRPSLIVSLGAAGVGYVLPGMVLGRMAKRRQHRIRLSLPDALDLLVVSVEAGLGLDQAIQRVGDELAFAHPDLSDELRLINLELRAGNARADALHNLAHRTGVDDVSSLVAMLVPASRSHSACTPRHCARSGASEPKRRPRKPA
jgi:tight adherence protein C